MEAEQFKQELLQYVNDRINDGCNRNVALMHAASQARGAARALKLMRHTAWTQYDALADEFWALCFIDVRYARLDAPNSRQTPG